ncbi:hypothetical protein A3SI_15036 [Nitritalea halalkaliphila LW7]|uniref:Uncharacterized protein n=1 Tax=Nitritalea halalkaliphila LW7 TaxID=1189621 RepID=I5BYW1_9BACT|nr:hypothetical protein A3SI_15036 [Nitritalea halalkaliphila LW7]
MCIMQHEKVVADHHGGQAHSYFRVVVVPKMFIKKRTGGDHQQQGHKGNNQPNGCCGMFPVLFFGRI